MTDNSRVPGHMKIVSTFLWKSRRVLEVVPPQRSDRVSAAAAAAAWTGSWECVCVASVPLHGGAVSVCVRVCEHAKSPGSDVFWLPPPIAENSLM